MKTRKNNNNLLAGLAGLLGVIVIVSLIGLYATKPEPVIIQGEAEAKEYRVSGKIPGRVSEILTEEGAWVNKGDTLAIISSPELNAKLEQAIAARDAAQAQNRKAIKGARPEQIMGAYELWQKAEVGVDISAKSYERVDKLFEKKVVPAQKRDEAEAQYKAAIATAKAAKSQYEMAINGAEKEDREAALALVNRATGAIKEVESYLDEAYIVAPSSGEISEIFPEEGSLVGTGAPIMSITDLTQMWFTFSVREDLLNGLTLGTVVKVQIPALGKEEYEAKVTFIKAMASYATWRSTKVSGGFDAKSFELKATPITPIKALRPGMTVIIKTVVNGK
ncbi:MAG: efflux RND transporter periplasmic adaptor subunit [Bacteroidales bacterium]|nr:efflux RND transporter periplasmic adaptor subunit [Bacteroidales bacterium]